jgi:serine/threonine-protein phosphatase 5
MKRSPGDKDANAKFTECEKIVKRMAFEKAIEVFYYVNYIINSIKINDDLPVTQLI